MMFWVSYNGALGVEFVGLKMVDMHIHELVDFMKDDNDVVVSHNCKMYKEHIGEFFTNLPFEV